MNIEQIIFTELKENHNYPNALFKFQHYNSFRIEKTDLTFEEFEETLIKLCNKGFFIREKDGSVYAYRITEKTYKMINS